MWKLWNCEFVRLLRLSFLFKLNRKMRKSEIKNANYYREICRKLQYILRNILNRWHFKETTWFLNQWIFAKGRMLPLIKWIEDISDRLNGESIKICYYLKSLYIFSQKGRVNNNYSNKNLRNLSLLLRFPLLETGKITFRAAYKAEKDLT